MDQLKIENGVEEAHLLPAINDDHGGVVVELKEHMDPAIFLTRLKTSMSYWTLQGKKGVWIKLPIHLVNLVETAVKEGFCYHHAEPDYLMLVNWIPETTNTIPANASHRVGVGAVVLNDKRELLVVQEKNGIMRGKNIWKIPTGIVEEGEDISEGVIREVKEETGSRSIPIGAPANNDSTMMRNVSTRQHEIEKTLKELEKMMLYVETNAVASADRLDRSIAELKAMIEEIIVMNKNNHNANHRPTTEEQQIITTEGRQSSHTTRLPKINFPRFSRKDIDGWLYKVELFFNIYETPEQLKLSYVAMHLEGDVLHWHMAYMKTKGVSIDELPWMEYVRSISERFSDSTNAIEELISLYQTESLKDYFSAFDTCLSKVTICEEFAISIFLKGLKPEIRYPVKILQPKTLLDAYSLARMQDNANAALNNN